jgi:hypothetical protein
VPGNPLARCATVLVLLLTACQSRGGAGAPGVIAGNSPTATALPDSTPDGGLWWQAAPGMSWQWQLSALPIERAYDVDVFDIDLFDNSAGTVAALHAEGRTVICYLNAGAWEAWRPDADQYPISILGNDLDGWEGERWLDIRQLDLLGPLLEARLDLCRDKGFDGVEPDNVDGYANNSGFPLTYADQLAFNLWLAEQAHRRGLSVGLKNDLDQIPDLLPYFDWALNEECFAYDECDALLPFVDAGKAVFHVEYALEAEAFCPQANRMGFSSLKKNLALDAARVPCR